MDKSTQTRGSILFLVAFVVVITMHFLPNGASLLIGVLFVAGLMIWALYRAVRFLRKAR
jgi:hypothetical protein